MAYGAGAAAAAAAAIANAIKASGSIVKMKPEQFTRILGKMSDGVVVVAEGGFFSKKHHYLTSYKGLFFFTDSNEPISITGKVEVILAEKIWIPG